MLKKGSFFIIPLLFISTKILADVHKSGINMTHSIKWGMLTMGLLGGLALFLFGMDMMSWGMKQVAGKKMRSFLAAVTHNRVVGLITGAFVTMVIQSSSATTVMLVSFVQAELMTFVQTLGVILGADIGTTITAQMIAFKLTDYALLMVAIGFSLQMFSKKEKHRYIGKTILGFGILFYGMKVMSGAMKPLRSYEPFIHFLEGLENPILGILTGAAFTALIQSSSAFTGVVIVLAQQNLISLEAGIPLIMGANIGTCVTAGLASIGASRDAKRVALAHVLFKIGGVLLFILWIPTFASLVKWVAGYFDSGTARQIANAHTFFNVLMAIVFLPFVGLFARLIEKLMPITVTEKKDEEDDEDEELTPNIRHLDNNLIGTPDVAIELARREIYQMTKLVEKMVEFVIIPFQTDNPPNDRKYPQLSLLEGVKVRERKVDYLEEKINEYLLKVSRSEIDDEERTEIFNLISIMNDMESIGDVIEKNVIPLIAKKHALKRHFSQEGSEELKIFHLKICKQISRIKFAFKEMDPKKAKNSVEKMETYMDLESEYRMKHLRRICQQREESIETHEVHMELMDLLKQINVYTGDIAKKIVTIASQ